MIDEQIINNEISIHDIDRIVKHLVSIINEAAQKFVGKPIVYPN